MKYSYLVSRVIKQFDKLHLAQCTHCMNNSEFYSFEYSESTGLLSTFGYCKEHLNWYLTKQFNYTSIKYFPYHKDYDLFMKQLKECELAYKKILLLR